MFAELARLADVHGFEPMLIAFPIVDQVNVDYVYDFPQRQLRAVARDLDLPLLDLLPIFRDAWRRGERDLFYDWCHPTPRGSEIIAAEVLRFVQGRRANGSREGPAIR